MNRFYKFLLIPILSVFFLSCNEDPTSTGADLLPEDGKIQFKQFDTQVFPVNQSSATFNAEVDFDQSITLLLGKNSYAESVMLLNFSDPFTDSMVTYYKNNQFKIRKTWMEMIPVYKLGEESRTFDFNVHQIRSGWSSAGFDKDSLALLSYDASNVSFDKKITDTLITFQINNSVMDEMLKYQANSSTGSQSYGFYFKPTSNCERIIGFNSYDGYLDGEFLPVLKIEYQLKTTIIDTILVTPLVDVHVVTGSIPNQNQYIYLQGGLALRGFLSFDLSSLPKDIIINSAKLELSVDSLKSFNGLPASDSIEVKALKDSVAKTFTSDSLIVSVLKKTNNVYSGEITWLIQRWLSSNVADINQGMQLSLADEIRSASRIAIHSSRSTDLLKRPRLKIVYMQKK